uniref:Uncharacterized protein n=1 Tax=Anguilla anguilla TaxID=7936 RepID=A0A0E9S6W8_ANGAN
MAHRERFMKV